MELSTSERKLLTRAIHREPEAFSELYLQYRPSVLRHVYYIVGSPEEADDITSETFLRAWKAIGTFEDRGVSILAWLLRIAYNLSNQHFRRRKPTLSVKDVDGLLFDDHQPDVAAERALRLQAVSDALKTLPKIQRQVVMLRFMNDLDYDEIAAITGKSKGALRVIQHRAFQALRRHLAEPDLEAIGLTDLLPERASVPSSLRTLGEPTRP
jgi:RNA polymerase sigma-70 factor (ECF subfamily)